MDSGSGAGMTDRGGRVRSLGLDVGDVRIGVAMSDPTGTVVEPLTTIKAGTRAAAIEKIAELVEQECVGEVVVGTPVSLDGEVGPQARKIRSVCGPTGRADIEAGADVGRKLLVSGGG